MSEYLAALQAEQAAAAGRALAPSAHRVMYPYAEWHALAGYHQPGEIDMLGAFTGGGKSTIVASLILRHLANGVAVVLGGFELGPDVWRRVLAAAVVGVDPGAVMSAAWEDWPADQYASAYAKVQAQIAAMGGARAKGTAWELLHIVDEPYVSARTMGVLGQYALDVERATKQPSLIFVDHIDHTDPDGNELAITKQAVFTLHQHGKQHGTRWFMTSQLNREGSPNNPFFQHYPLKESYFRGASHKANVCTRVWGGYRPLRPDATPEDINLVKQDRKPLADLLAPGVTALNCIKGRWTRSVGKRILLGWERGLIVDLPAADRDGWDLADRDRTTTPPTRRHDRGGV